MSMQSFDIESLLQLTPPKYFCEKCYALLPDAPRWDSKTRRARCPVCGVEYLPTKDFASWQVGGYLKSQSLDIQFNDLIEQSQRLATIARRARVFLASPDTTWHRYPPMRALFEALQNAEKFVHFTTYGISHMLLGAIKMTAQRVDVRGIVSNVDANKIEELTKYPDEAPNMKIVLFERTKNWDEIPHQKMVVVDGLMAFKGSANLTISGWRKAARGREIIEVVTDVKEVVDIHNRFFSPIWAGFSDIQQIQMETVRF